MMKQPFEQAVTVHRPMVLRVCRAVLGSHTDADDAWAETFLDLMEAWPGMPEATKVEAWLVHVAHRKAIDVTRRRSRHAIPTNELPEPASSLGQPDDQMEIWASVKSLPPKQRQAVAYHYLGGLAYGEIAELIGGSTDAARRAASDGIKSLRRHHLFAGVNLKGDPR
ncbi:sigma-70 family RNA polymerase sigma factor [Arthrobacter sp. UYCu712]|uniref:RNA polymerase sigma factor n=1 Tax=Arthrobacter sp. UYCu712 TaxID=3156340 RepID=UPI0033998C8F